MKTGHTLFDLAGELDRQMSSKRDLVVPSSLLQCRTDEGGDLKMGSPQKTEKIVR